MSTNNTPSSSESHENLRRRIVALQEELAMRDEEIEELQSRINELQEEANRIREQCESIAATRNELREARYNVRAAMLDRKFRELEDERARGG